jgi:hypothetical protein
MAPPRRWCAGYSSLPSPSFATQPRAIPSHDFPCAPWRHFARLHTRNNSAHPADWERAAASGTPGPQPGPGARPRVSNKARRGASPAGGELRLAARRRWARAPRPAPPGGPSIAARGGRPRRGRCGLDPLAPARVRTIAGRRGGRAGPARSRARPHHDNRHGSMQRQRARGRSRRRGGVGAAESLSGPAGGAARHARDGPVSGRAGAARCIECSEPGVRV